MASKLFDRTVLGDAELALEFIGNILESSTEYSIIGKDLDGTILLWNEGARRMYGYESSEVVGQANSKVLHTPEDVALGKPQEMIQVALRDGEWEGIIGPYGYEPEEVVGTANSSILHVPEDVAAGLVKEIEALRLRSLGAEPAHSDSVRETKGI